MDSKTLIDKNYQNRGIDGLLVGLLKRCIQVEEVALDLRVSGFRESVCVKDWKSWTGCRRCEWC